MKKYVMKNGFTLPEILISISIFSLVMVAITGLVVSVMRSNTLNLNKLIGYGLAQEGIEAVRNMRDSDWLLGATFDGRILVGNSGKNVWGDVIDGGRFVVDLNYLGGVVNKKNVNVNSIFNVAPWRFEKVSNDKDTLLKRCVYSDDGVVMYLHNGKSGMSCKDSAFHREIDIKPVFYGDDGDYKLRVTSRVFWEEYGRDVEVVLKTELTDWK